MTIAVTVIIAAIIGPKYGWRWRNVCRGGGGGTGGAGGTGPAGNMVVLCAKPVSGSMYCSNRMLPSCSSQSSDLLRMAFSGVSSVFCNLAELSAAQPFLSFFRIGNAAPCQCYPIIALGWTRRRQ